MSVARLARSASTRSASTIRNVASERRSAPKISKTFAYAQCCTDQSFGLPLTSKGPRLLHRRDRKGEGRYSWIAQGGVVLLEAVNYTRSARTIKRFWKVGIGVQVCNVTMSLPLTCPITHESAGSARNVSLTRYSYPRPVRSLSTTLSPSLRLSRL